MWDNPSQNPIRVYRYIGRCRACRDSKLLRDELGLSPGDRLSVESDGQRVIVQPVCSATAMRKEQGVWVFRSGEALSAAETESALREVRRSRDRSARGSGG